MGADRHRGLTTPPTLFLAGLLVVVLLHVIAPGPRVASSPLTWLVLPLVIAGLGLNVVASVRFERLGTPIRPFTESTSLDTGGVFAVSRNPMYLGMALVLVGSAFGFGTLTPFFVPPLFLVIMHRAFVVREEAMLEQIFGDAYRKYRRHVRRWL
jgi:protein-S-isoprenylcysteine O-methyltransferase Ste14